MPEVGNFVLPTRLIERGVTDMVRISDARMSGTGFGTVVLHVAPEAAIGGPLALVGTGDWIELDVPARTLTLDVSDNELARRRAEWSPPPPAFSRGYAQLYVEHSSRLIRALTWTSSSERAARPYLGTTTRGRCAT